MAFRTSYSQNSTYIQCPKHWEWSYVEKYRSSYEGASIYFGAAVDAAVMLLLEKPQEDFIKKFYDRWDCAIVNNKPVTLFDNPAIIYANSDFDEYVLDKATDMAQLWDWAKELGVDSLGRNGVEVYKEILKIKKNPYRNTGANELKFFNRASWLSMKRKGKYLLEAFKNDFYPKIKKVHATQKRATITDPTSGDSIVGVIDMVVELEGYEKPIIFDLKTAAMPYSQEQIETTEQLTLYAAMCAYEFNTDLVGYVVLPKAIRKDIVSNCGMCGHAKSSKHRTCDNVINGVRCNGAWVESRIPKPEVQVLIQSKTPEQVEELLKDIANIVLAMKNKIVYKNTNKCENWYGNKCPFYNACHKGDMSGLIKKG